jgi:hypothetical protein
VSAPLRLRIEVAEAPDARLLPAAIAARLAGRTFPAEAEDRVAEQVAVAVREQLAGEEPRWR